MKSHNGEIACVRLTFLKKVIINFEQISTQNTNVFRGIEGQPKSRWKLQMFKLRAPSRLYHAGCVQLKQKCCVIGLRSQKVALGPQSCWKLRREVQEHRSHRRGGPKSCINLP